MAAGVLWSVQANADQKPYSGAKGHSRCCGGRTCTTHRECAAEKQSIQSAVCSGCSSRKNGARGGLQLWRMVHSVLRASVYRRLVLRFKSLQLFLQFFRALLKRLRRSASNGKIYRYKVAHFCLNSLSNFSREYVLDVKKVSYAIGWI